MKKLFLLLALLVFFGLPVLAQSASCPEGMVCLTQPEANEIYRLAEIGKKYPAYAAKAEADLKTKEDQKTELKIELARAVQKVIDLEKSELERKAELEQYRQYFFTKSKNKCWGICVQ